MKKSLLALLITLSIASTAYAFGLKVSYERAGTSGNGWRTNPTFYVSSTTTFTLTTASQRLLATTSKMRIAATVQPIACNVAQPVVFLETEVNDKAATANNGLAVFGTTTPVFGSYPNLPVWQGSIQGITGAGSCTVLVTEWISQN